MDEVVRSRLYSLKSEMFQAAGFDVDYPELVESMKSDFGEAILGVLVCPEPSHVVVTTKGLRFRAGKEWLFVRYEDVVELQRPFDNFAREIRLITKDEQEFRFVHHKYVNLWRFLSEVVCDFVRASAGGMQCRFTVWGEPSDWKDLPFEQRWAYIRRRAKEEASKELNAVSLFMVSDDLRDFERFLQSAGKVTVIGYRLAGPAIEAPGESFASIPNTEEGLMSLGGDRRPRVHLVPTRYLYDLKLTHVSKEGYWTINLDASPAVEVVKGIMIGKQLRFGAIHYRTHRYTEDRGWITKPREFLAWAESAIEWVRTTCERLTSGYYLGPHAKMWLEGSGGELVVDSSGTTIEPY